MNESIPEKSPKFVFPNIQNEKGELERVATTFGIDSSVLYYEAKNGEMVVLENDVWTILENTDSNKIDVGDFVKVKEFSDEYKRDWVDLKTKIESGKTIDAPIIMKYGSRYHLVSGNTRLMVSRALDIQPRVLLFEVYNHEEKV
ncbi:MAG: hypothetical protein RLZZ76_96 [Candidatus Parcubacteria bacterium]|jgi:hypothetical protein